MSDRFDMAIVGGGIMGCATALRVAGGGMRAIILDQGDLGQGASGVNAGTLSLQIKRIKLMQYAIRGHARWESMGAAVGYHKSGGYTLAFTEHEEGMLLERQTLKREAGAPITFVSPDQVYENEPELGHHIRAASYCRDDGYANSSLTGRYYRKALAAAGIPYHERQRVCAIEAADTGFEISIPSGPVRARRLLLASGAWLKHVAAMIGVTLPVQARINTVSVTERAPTLISSVLGHATGLLTMKQKQNGTVLIGGGWQGDGSPATHSAGGVNADTLVPNLALAQYVLPALSQLRVVRSWTGYEANVPDFLPLAGALPVKNAFVLGCVRGGYTIGPYISELMGDLILGREPELPLFDPMRDFSSN